MPLISAMALTERAGAAALLPKAPRVAADAGLLLKAAWGACRARQEQTLFKQGMQVLAWVFALCVG